MVFYRQVGEVPRTRHTQMRRPSGELYQEELVSTLGFDGASSLLYHLGAPTSVRSIKSEPSAKLVPFARDVVRHHRFHTMEVSTPGDFLSARTPFFFNADIVVSVCTPDRPSEGFYRNGSCDELVFVHEGEGTLRSPFGSVRYGANDWVYIPRTTTVQWIPSDAPQRLLITESIADIAPPARYFSKSGQFLESAPLSERAIRGPEYQEPIEESGEFHVFVKHGQLVSGYSLSRHPFDVIGWDGCFYPYAINVFDFQPMVQAVHTMPNVHEIFQTAGAAICNFVPRLADFHPLAIPAAPAHSSVDCDEIVYLVSGKMMNRVGDGPGTMTLHPRGIPHGPKPGTYERSIGQTERDGVAINIDAFRPLELTVQAVEIDDPAYPTAWLD